MKAIYINLDPYLAAFAAWLKGGKSGPAPKFNPLPLAVTIPLGESAAIYLNGFKEGDDVPSMDYVVVDGQSVGVFESVGDGDNIGTNITPALSTLAPGAHYYARAVAGDSVAVTVILADDEGNEFPFVQGVLVRRERASGPVDLVDYTPPAAAPSAADIKSALVAAGSGALEGVSIASAVLNDGEEIVTDLDGGLRPYTVGSGDTIVNVIGYVTQS